MGLPFLEKLTDRQYAALIDFVFNLGIGAFEGSTLHEMLVEGKVENVPHELARWIYAGQPQRVLQGLVKRRAAESELWQAAP